MGTAAGQEDTGAGDAPAPGGAARGQEPEVRPPVRDDRRGESGNQRLDRNWQDMLQELRVMQAGIQILAGFLLTLPFQSRFEKLDDVQVTVYLCLVCLSVLIQVLMLSTVNLHRALFDLHVKGTLVGHTAAMIPVAAALVGLGPDRGPPRGGGDPGRGGGPLAHLPPGRPPSCARTAHLTVAVSRHRAPSPIGRPREPRDRGALHRVLAAGQRRR